MFVRTSSIALPKLFLLHACLWVLLAFIIEGSVRLDVSEGIIGGPAWQLSYLRHPPLSTWLIGLLWYFGPLRYIALYMLGQFSMLLGLVVALRFLTRTNNQNGVWPAAMAFLLSPFSTYIPLQFNHNICVTPFWSLALMSSWFAFERGLLKDWLIFGITIGCGMWAKYAILHLIVPLSILFLFTPTWRSQLLTTKPWLALGIFLIIITPHAADVYMRGSTTINFALRTEDVSIGQRFIFCTEFAINALLYNIVMGFIVGSAIGLKRLKLGLKNIIKWLSSSRFDMFVIVASIGPIILVMIAALFGVRPRILWLTPFSISFVLFWGRVVVLSKEETFPQRSIQIYAIISTLMVLIYICIHFLTSLFSAKMSYPEIDGRALAHLAEKKWTTVSQNHIPYIVSFGDQHGRQAAGSIAFDLPYRVQVLENNSLRDSPWINISDLERRGALIIAPHGLSNDTFVGKSKITDIEIFPLPKIRGPRSISEIKIGIVRPKTQ